MATLMVFQQATFGWRKRGGDPISCIVQWRDKTVHKRSLPMFCLDVVNRMERHKKGNMSFRCPYPLEKCDHSDSGMPTVSQQTTKKMQTSPSTCASNERTNDRQNTNSAQSSRASSETPPF
ncbi:hypothetical protein QOT17_000524 [Balamuthia mandrillaris]